MCFYYAGQCGRTCVTMCKAGSILVLWMKRFWNIKSSQMIMQLQYDYIKTMCSVQSHVAHCILIKYVARSKVKINVVIWCLCILYESERRYSFLPGYNSMCLKGLNKLAQMTIYDNVCRVKEILVGQKWKV